jgi:superfamily I DNA and/or RNA helicase
MMKKSSEYKNIPVLTIDQCQGQEADLVILSLVKKPTKFLNKNRLNVALSRVRKELYFLCDLPRFVQASKNSRWESHLLARSILRHQEVASLALESKRKTAFIKATSTFKKEIKKL